jgi:CRISPR-associated protein Cmr6
MSVRAVLSKLTHARCTNAGLWHDVFIPQLRQSDSAQAFGEILREHLEQVTETAVPEGYREAFQERERLLRSLRGAVVGAETRCFDAKAEGRLVVGLGSQSVLESNLGLLRAWGVPYIAGSALKGLASSAAHRRGGESWKRASVTAAGGCDAKVLFGDTDSQGIVCFHDAWWVPESDGKLPLDLDVMTVHHPYYYGRGKKAPLDWDEPNPVSFLTARGTYLVALTGPAPWLDVAADWLKLALHEDGIGAKTHAGYGRMSLTPRLSEHEKQRASLLNELKELPAQHRGASTAKTHVEKFQRAINDGIAVDSLRPIAKALYQKEPNFWWNWARDAKRTETERELLTTLEMIPVQAAAASMTPSVPAASTTSTVAWIARDAKNRLMVCVQLEGRVVSMERRLVTVEDPSLIEALESSSEASPVPVRVTLRRKDKIERLDPR